MIGMFIFLQNLQIDDFDLPVRNLLGRDHYRPRGHIPTETILDFSLDDISKPAAAFMAETLKNNSQLTSLNKISMEGKLIFDASREGLEDYEINFIGQRMKANNSIVHTINLSSNLL